MEGHVGHVGAGRGRRGAKAVGVTLIKVRISCLVPDGHARQFKMARSVSRNGQETGHPEAPRAERKAAPWFSQVLRFPLCDSLKWPIHFLGHCGFA